MDLLKTINNMKSWVKINKNNNKTLALVPTMGFLHIGHLSLIKRAKEISDKTVLSIYVNPSQFNANEDLDRYPRDLEGDLIKAKESGVDCVFIPENIEMYPDNYQTWVEVTKLQKGLCGEKRPGHFRGVATVVLKLFNIVKPDFAVFGEKDFQQLAIVRQMVRDLNLDVDVVSHPTIRENTGLAYSSRNAYLSQHERETVAPLIYKTIKEAKDLVKNGEKNSNNIRLYIEKRFSEIKEFNVDYIFIGNKITLDETPYVDNNSLIAVAVWLKNTRLIDNIQICTE